ncbi:hypothetical protein [Streptomyces griseocarneus]|uniref:hypothetical protein n=1 Tax=Streptomyces griseocarneus TaxID=51201 RepID=UPI00167E9788|nr:hypothetical protein [Streptomyces griseocarneus]MBZ6476753.1 hypothetical protein [Streptomyces griseocarneus]
MPDTETLLDTVRGVSGAWLRKKFPRTAVQLGTGQHALDESSLLMSQAAYDDNGAEYATRIQLREDKAEATWRTTVTAVRSTTGGTVSVDLECFPNSAQPFRTSKPRLIRELVAELEPRDGMSRLSINALRVTHDRVHSLVDVLCDPERQMPTVVAARPMQPDPLWSERVAGMMRQLAGDASTYLLWDLATVDAFREALGHDHRVGPGCVRTFLPLVDPAWAPDAAVTGSWGPDGGPIRRTRRGAVSPAACTRSPWSVPCPGSSPPWRSPTASPSSTGRNAGSPWTRRVSSRPYRRSGRASTTRSYAPR